MGFTAPQNSGMAMKVLLFANSDWYLYNFRLPLAQAIAGQGHDVTLMSPDGRYRPQIEQAGFRWIPFALDSQGTHPVRELLTLWRLMKIYRAEKPQLAHHFTIKCVLYGSIAAKVAGVRTTINAITGVGYLFQEDSLKAKICRALVKKFYSFALRGTKTIFQNKDDLGSYLQQRLVQADRCFLSKGSGVNVERFTPTRQTRPAAPVRILFAARLLWNKGVQELLDAAEIVSQLAQNIEFVIAGETCPGHPAAVAPSIIAQWQTRNNLQFLGHRNDMADLLHSADIVVLPSYREGTPRILLEAAACGLPLIATDVPGCREIVRPGVNGILVPVGDGARLAAAILELATDAGRRRSMGRQSRSIVCQEFSEHQVISETLAVYTGG
jgi:glycosyltransferase involved in cell wall biosynthesis